MTVSCGVHFYSGWYLEGDPHLSRYMLYIGAFTALMLVLSMSTGLAIMFAFLLNRMGEASSSLSESTLVPLGFLVACAAAGNPLLEASSGSTMAGVALLGSCTAVYAGITALRQTDLKRVIAFSTCSQVAYMVLGCSTGQYTAAFSLLILHALYKAVLFLGAGAVIHALAGLQDLRLMGGLSRFLPFTATIMLMAMAALGAAPYTSGDFSKDIIIETQLGRLHYLAFEGLPRATSAMVSGLHDPTTPTVRVILTLLGVLSIVAGYCLSEVFVPNAGVLGLAEYPSTSSPLDTEYSTSALFVTLPLVASALGLFVGTTGVSVPVDLKRSRRLSYLAGILSQTKWGTDSFLAQGVSRTGLSAAYISYKTLDRGLFELVGPFGLSTSLLALAHSRLGVSGPGISRLVLLTAGATLGFGIAAYFGASLFLVVVYIASLAIFL
ncbi:NADH dehydrogenase subunits 2, 5, and related proteins [Phaffia rhodozyma]|uniref:NADH dehydrogenase subunits 2, 5, and related proteins n=1 Tax=Phaffia rhodozyma TaxID=264483 RepID=A0A0F7SF89_PHARH|nr:NADH dehydrogenase subunits 2, 5, and related proteins [Phaffia rhodozyma]